MKEKRVMDGIQGLYEQYPQMVVQEREEEMRGESEKRTHEGQHASMLKTHNILNN